MAQNSQNKSPQELLGTLLRGSGLTLSAAESCTGGMISHLITTVPGSSEYYLGSVTSYAVRLKESLLNVKPETVADNGIVSSAVACGMAEGVRALTGSTFAVATTGWADSYGDDHEPAGTCWIAVSGPLGTVTKRSRSQAGRVANIDTFACVALETLVGYIAEYLNS